MKIYRKATFLVAGVSAIATTAQVHAQVAGDSAAAGEPIPDSIVVTGSRVATTGNEAPTPVTVVTTEQLLETTPANISDAINRLPQFSAQPSTRNIGSAQGNSIGNYLDLRKFGSNRTLILLDGNRLPPTAASGAIDTNIIPQSLVERVEVVTGGASAVYGSDAVTGVVNFVLDKDFTGVKYKTQFGTSTYGDADSWRIGVAAGTPLFEGRGHMLFSFDNSESDGLIYLDSRKNGEDNWIVGGDGSENNPFRLVQHGRTLLGSRGGMTVGNNLPPELQNIVFNNDGVATPFIHGGDAGVRGIESGGDGGVYDTGTLVAPLNTTQFFGRFDYNLTDNLTAFVQGSYSIGKSKWPYSSARYVSRIRSGNPFIPADIQQIMTDTGTDTIDIGRLQSRHDGLPGRINDSDNQNIFVMTGLEGQLFGDFKWDANYIYARNRLKVINHNNTSTPRFAAALDAVVDPATGRVVCHVSLTEFADRYAGCEPLNVFGPTAPSKSAYDWITDDTHFVLTNKMHSVNSAITGTLFSWWAGDVRMAISGEYRWMTLDNNSSVEGTDPPDCTGIRDGMNCIGSPAWQHDVSESNYAKQNVKELAAELLVPLATDLPFINSLDLNLAGRVTDYSTSGSVETWKVGATWEPISSLRFRAVRSRDIRAPTLTDLFAPESISVSGFTDIHTGISAPVVIQRSGNPNLTPEIAYTNTLGVVFDPDFLPGFSLAIDYYDIKINNAIVGASGFSVDIQRECEASDGTSPLCDLLIRPLPFSDRSPANFPTGVRQRSVNASKQWTRGVDVEANYNFDAMALVSSLPGDFSIRAIVSYQPTLQRQTLPSLPPQESAGIVANPTGRNGFSKVRTVVNLGYSSDRLDVRVAERWQSKQATSDPTAFDLRPDIPSYAYTDLFVSYDLDVGNGVMTPFVTIENLFNKREPLIGGQNNVPGLFYPTGRGFDVIGRYFTVGVRGNF